MSDYGCCTTSFCIHENDYESCDECPCYDKDFFKELYEKDVKKKGESENDSR